VATASGGTAPYTFQMLSPAGAPISNGTATTTFAGLTAGSYQYRVTDNTGAFQTRTVTLTNPASVSYVINPIFNGWAQVNVCDSIDFASIYVGITGTARPNYKLEVWTNANSASGSPDMTINRTVSNFANVRLPIASTSYEPTISNTGVHFIRVTDSCGNTTSGVIRTNELFLKRQLSKTTCNQTVLDALFLGLKAPVTFNLFSGSTASGPVLQTQIQTSSVNASPTYDPYYGYSYGATFPISINGTYTVQATDACGRVVTRTFNNFTPITKVVQADPSACNSFNAMNGTGYTYFNTSMLQGPKIITFLSGPTTYTNPLNGSLVTTSINYPIKDTSTDVNGYRVYGMIPGTYRIAFQDSCGWTDTINVTMSSVSNIVPSYTITPGCLNANSVTLNLSTGCGAGSNIVVRLRNSSGVTVGSSSVAGTGISYTINNLPAGTYTYELYTGLSSLFRPSTNNGIGSYLSLITS
ncbi:MAG: hypothetical protein ACOVOV_09515, partial [Dolichospermum sp.]